MVEFKSDEPKLSLRSARVEMFHFVSLIKLDLVGARDHFYFIVQKNGIIL